MTTILANGVAAKCCAHLLKGVPIQGDDRPRVPALMISSATQALVEDVFGRTGIFGGAAKISKRVVRWGEAAEIVEMPHSAVVISEADLVGQLGICGAPNSACRVDNHVDTICFGARLATAFPVVGKTTDACWIESVDRGWLFLLPGWLLAVGEASLDQSKLITGQITSIGEPVGRFPAYPRISDPLCGDDWLACGSAAMTFDPICGDGVGNAIREAILATAVIRASAQGEVESLHAHYRTRLTAGFLKHLELCRPFYAACSGDWWVGELKLLDEGIAWCREQLRNAPPFRYRLEGFDLKMVS
jgi:hypothetical protein